MRHVIEFMAMMKLNLETGAEEMTDTNKLTLSEFLIHILPSKSSDKQNENKDLY